MGTSFLNETGEKRFIRKSVIGLKRYFVFSIVFVQIIVFCKYITKETKSKENESNLFYKENQLNYKIITYHSFPTHF